MRVIEKLPPHLNLPPTLRRGEEIGGGEKGNSHRIELTKGILLKESLIMGNTISLTLTGKSMEPFIPEGSSLTVKAAHIDTVRAGDIILFINKDMVIAHRLFKKVRQDNGIFLKVKPDASASFDPLIHSDNLIGKVVSIRIDRKTVSLNNPISYFYGFFISRITLITGYISAILRAIASAKVDFSQ